MSKIFLFAYNLLFVFLIVISLIPAFILSRRFRREISYCLRERFAFISPIEKNGKKLLWFHCASLGEVRAIEPILNKLKTNFSIFLTVATKSGREYTLKIDGINSALFPLDLYPLMLKTIDTIKPDMLIVVETEIWPSMLYSAHKRGVKIAVVNARMSDKTYRIYKKAAFFWKHFIGLIDIALARSKEDGDRFACFSSKKMRIFVTGNIKYDRDFSSGAARENMGFGDEDMIFTAGSVRGREVKIIGRVYKNISIKHPNIKFFLAPRHLDRLDEIKKLLSAMKIKFSLFSQGAKDSNFILVDVFGKLQDIYSISDICFVGGSIVNTGGQNPIEPAAYAKPVLFGENMDNFKTEAETLLAYGGAVKVSTTTALTRQILSLLEDRGALMDMGEKALYAVKSQRGAVSASIEKIKEILSGNKK
jgi:3-deoxy-D-manno-octulosonic-acid transferase